MVSTLICKIRIPVIFEGDLAHTANCHLKKNDRVHITGQIFVDASEIAGAKPDQAYVHVRITETMLSVYHLVLEWIITSFFNVCFHDSDNG